MKKIHSKKKHFNIRKGFWFLASFALVMVLSLWGFPAGTFSKAAPAGNPLFTKTIEQFYRDSGSWSAFDNSKNNRDLRSMTFATYYSSCIKPDVASRYNWPLTTAYSEAAVSVDHNQTKVDANHDLYLVEFSTANEISNPNINMCWSLYYIEKSSSDGLQYIKHTSATELSRESRDFMGRSDRTVEFQQGEVEMATISLPKGAVPIGICLWLHDKDSADLYCPWELSYMNIYKVDSVSGIYNKNITDADPSTFYRVVTGTRTG